ncbi:MAG TPA: glycosyltransferase [Anaeromyxobacteraceae bacterium]|nr:glycosyltransferase [Anaeromyxobacteraceae bacterium]
MSRIQVSVVIPAFNEGLRLPAFVEDIARLASEASAPPVEFLVVDDGSSPDHLARHEEAVERARAVLAGSGSPHAVRLLREGRNRGKGAAIRSGWRQSDPQSGWLGFVDGDGAVPAREVWRLVGLLDPRRFDLLAGARIRMAGHRVERSLVRHLQGRVFATFAEQIIPNGFYDTQCGIKFAAAARLRACLEALAETRWLLDLELITLLQRAGARCVEEPIDWSDPGGSKVVPLLDPLKMLLGLLRLRRRLLA